MTDAPKLLSREELEQAFVAFATAAPRIDHLRAVRAHIAALQAERDALRRFKEYVHARLDHMGVPVCPPGPHLDAGCRIGQRLDWLLTERDALKLWKAERLMWGDAAYARGLEDAAKVADEVAENFVAKDAMVRVTAYEIAAAIRALKPGDNKLKQGEADASAKSE